MNAVDDDRGAEGREAAWVSARARLPRALARASITHPGWTLIGWLMALLFVAPGWMGLTVDTSTDSVLDKSGRQWTFYQESQALFGGDEIIVVALSAENPWDAKSLVEVARLTDAFEGLDGVSRVDSIASLPVIYVNQMGDLELDPAWLGSNDAALNDAVERARDRAARDRILPRSLVSDDARTLALTLVLEHGAERRHEALLAEVEALTEELDARVSGVPVFRVEANRRTGREILTFAPLTGVVISAFLFWMFRSALAVGLCLLPGLVGVCASTAAMGAFGSSLSISTMVLPSTILAIGCAYAMHVLTATSGCREPTSLQAALSSIALPIATSGLTTAVGFLALTWVRIEVVWATGAFGALGVLVVTLATLTLVPAVLALHPLPTSVPRGMEWVRGPLADALTDLADRRRGWLFATWALLSAAVGVGIFSVQIETDATRWLPVGHPVRDAYESIRSELSGISPMNIVIEAPVGESVFEVETLAAIDGLTLYLDAQPEVGKAISVADPLRQIHGGFVGDPGMPLPSSRAAAEQYMLLLESVDLIDDVVSDDRETANVVLRVDDNGSARLMDVAARASTWWNTNGPAEVRATPTGIMFEFARAEEAIAHGQLRGLIVAFAVISVILFAAFNWPRLALVAMVPNTLPLVIIFGVMGLLGIPIDAGTIVMGSLALGIAVDDTIHVSTMYCIARTEGLSARDSVRRALSIVLPPVLASTFMLTAAFGLFAFSEFAITRNLGVLTASIMVLCLLADVTLLAALLLGLPKPPAKVSI